MEASNGKGPAHWRALWERWNRVDHDLEPYRRLALQLHYRLTPPAPRSILLVSPDPSSLSAQGSALLARSAAEALHQRVLLIDASPGAGDVSGLLEGAGRRGFGDLLRDPRLDLDDLVVPTSHQNVLFLPVGEYGAGADALGDNVGGLLAAAQRGNELVVLAGGSVLQSPLPLSLAPHVGCVLLLAVENETRIEDLDAAQQALSLARAREIGLVLTSPFVGKRWTL
jgi:hypothetical protein